MDSLRHCHVHLSNPRLANLAEQFIPEPTLEVLPTTTTPISHNVLTRRGRAFVPFTMVVNGLRERNPNKSRNDTGTR